MSVNGNLNIKRKSRKKSIIIAVIVILLAAVLVIGLTVGRDNEEYVASAVRENVQLKQQISELNEQILQLNEEIASLNGELEVRPTIEPTPYEMLIEPEETEAPEEIISPRSGLRADDEE